MRHGKDVCSSTKGAPLGGDRVRRLSFKPGGCPLGCDRIRRYVRARRARPLGCDKVRRFVRARMAPPLGLRNDQEVRSSHTIQISCEKVWTMKSRLLCVFLCKSLETLRYPQIQQPQWPPLAAIHAFRCSVDEYRKKSTAPLAAFGSHHPVTT